MNYIKTLIIFYKKISYVFYRILGKNSKLVTQLSNGINWNRRDNELKIPIKRFQ